MGALVVLLLSLVFWGRPPPPAPKPKPPPEPVHEGVVPSLRVEPVPVEPRVPDAVEQAEEALAELAGANGVVCPVQPTGIGAVARLHAELPEGFLGVATVGAGHVVLSDVPPEGEGVLLVEGFAPASIAWTEDGEGAHCVPKTIQLEPATTAVTGTVANMDSETTVEVCGRPAVVDADGAFYADASVGEDCAVRVRRHFGTFQWQDEVVVRPALGKDAVVSFEGPGFDAVLPLVLAAEPGGMRVVADWTGQELVGKLLVEAGGVEATGDEVAFQVLMGGEAGTLVGLRFSDGTDAEVALRVLSFDDWLVGADR
jgi:hypothetical protein